MVVPESSINNIMGGLESTGGVRLHNHKRKLKQRFDIVKKLGQGTYGKVQLGINKETGQEVAIKTIKKCKIETEADLIRIRREIQIMSSVQHPNIIHIYEVFENREKMVLVMEYAAGGELYDFLSERKVLAEEEARRIFRQISTAVYYCHKHKICHRDLKLENILLDENGNAKIADFGLSNVFDESRLLGTFCGSPLYASPEIVKGTPYHGPEVDCWSLGVLLYTLVYGAMPFDGSNFKRLVRQISQGDYFEPKKPSPASSLIRDMLNVNPSRRADVTAICSHWWIDQDQSERCLEVAEDLANQTPVRLDLLLCLAPAAEADKLLVGDQAPVQEGGDRPMRSQSLSSLASAASSAQPDFLPESTSRRDPEPNSKKKEEGGSVKRKERSRSRRERSRSRSRRDDSTPEPEPSTERPKRRSVKTKKSSKEKLVIEEPTEELLPLKIPEVEEELSKSTETIRAPNTPVNEVPKEKSPVPSDKVVIEELKSESPPEPLTPVADVPSQDLGAVASPPPVPQTEPPTTPDKVEETPTEDEKPTKPMERRKSKIFETAEKFNKIAVSEPQPKPQPKKMILAGVKVSDAKKAYERRSSLASSSSIIRSSASRKSLSGESSMSPPPMDDTKFSLASSVALNKLVENVEKLSKMEDEREKEKRAEPVEPKKVETPVKTSPEKVIEVKKEPKVEETHHQQDDEARKKVRNAVQVIGHALADGGSKAATLPRRKTSRAEIKLAMPVSKPPEFRSEVEHVVGSPVTVQRSEVKFPVAAPSPTPSTVNRANVRQGSAPREYIVPIQMETQPTAVKPPAPPSASPAQRPVSRTSSRSLSRQSTQDSDLGSSASIGEPIRKSPREVIIPIAVEGGGFVTPSADTISRMSSLNESGDDLPRGFGLHSTRRHNRQLETADSVSSDEDDDNFEILTAENLFSTLLSRVRSLTQRLNTEDRQTAFPRLLNHHHSIFDFPPRRLADSRSFGRADSVPWRRSASRESSTLPRDGSINRIGTPKRSGSLKSSSGGNDKPPLYRPLATRSSADNLRQHQPVLSSIPADQAQPTSEPNQLSKESFSSDAQIPETEAPKIPSGKIIRGIPTAEIVGSTASKLLKAESKSETELKSSKLPRMSPKPTAGIKQGSKKEFKEQENMEIKNMNQEENNRRNINEKENGHHFVGPSVPRIFSPEPLDEINRRNFKEGERSNELVTPRVQKIFSPEPQERRNSLERPSYYNSLSRNNIRSRESSMTRSFSLNQKENGELSNSFLKRSEYNDQFGKYDKYVPKSSKVDNGESSIAESDYFAARPYSTLGRTFSMKGPSAKSYDSIRTPRRSIVGNGDIDSKYNNSRISGLNEDKKISSRFLRPKSYYGETAVSSYQNASGVSTDLSSTGLDGLSDRKSAFVGRRSPSYQRSLSLFEGVRPETYRRSLSVTPDKSILGKFLANKNSEIEGEMSKSEIIDKPKTRRISRFLRPDFYDTPKEDSAYEKKERVKNSSNGEMWKEKDKASTGTTSQVKKPVKKPQLEKHPDKLGVVEKAIKSMRENSVDRENRESMSRESNLIKRAVSLEDCSLIPERRSRRSLSLTPNSNLDNKTSSDKKPKTLNNRKTDEHKTAVDRNAGVRQLNSKTESTIGTKTKRVSRKSSPETVKKQNGISSGKAEYCNGFAQDMNADRGGPTVDTRSRLSRIAGLKKLEFTRPIPSADSTPSMEESRMLSADLDDSSSFLSPTEDGSDTWSISSDYADTREFYSPMSAEDSVSERIRRKSFYSRFNQSKRKKSQSNQAGGSRSRLPMYSKSMSSDFGRKSASQPIRKISDPDRPNQH